MLVLKRKIKAYMPRLVSAYQSVRLFVYRNLAWFIYRRQSKVINNLSRIYQQHSRKIRVGFLVMENEKWGCQSFFDKLKIHSCFEPVLLLSSLDTDNLPLKQEKFYKNRAFFQKACGKIIEVYNPQKDQFYSLKPYNLDIIFYQQPWSINKKQNIFATSKFTLPCYIPYSFANDVKMIKQNLYNFHRLLFREYISHPFVEQEYLRAGLYEIPMKIVGYPKLEVYLKRTEQCGKKYVIYAPHHSIEPHSLRLGTFAWNGHFMLEYAKQHPELNWIFKPHPRCKVSFVAEGLFENRQELEDYYNQWRRVGKVCETGNYMDLFQQAQCLITDCGSFLVEFFPTEKPVIHLKRSDSNYDAIVSGLVASAYYSVFDLPTLKQTLYTVLEKGTDPLREERLKQLQTLQLVVPAADNIIKDIEATFAKKEQKNTVGNLCH